MGQSIKQNDSFASFECLNAYAMLYPLWCAMFCAHLSCKFSWYSFFLTMADWTISLISLLIALLVKSNEIGFIRSSLLYHRLTESLAFVNEFHKKKRNASICFLTEQISKNKQKRYKLNSNRKHSIINLQEINH